MTVFCTLFDSNYLDKGITMYRSLQRVCPEFRLYILAMDEKCEAILADYNYSNVILIPIDKFVMEVGLDELYSNRSRAEFCWTCTPYLIDYVLRRRGESICTYIDSDLYFYNDPKCLIDEMGDKTVQIVEHRYNHSMNGGLCRSVSGTYCVEFNTFKKSMDALKLLHWWKKKCYSSCSIMTKKKGVHGDQGYLEKWGNLPFVSVLQNLGGGVAPWNVVQYRLCSEEEPLLEEKRTNKKFILVFYHYHNISYYDSHSVNINIKEQWNEDKRLIDFLYIDYLKKIDEFKNELKKKYDFYPLLVSHPGIIDKTIKKGLRYYLGEMDVYIIHKMYDKYIESRKRVKYEQLNVISF